MKHGAVLTFLLALAACSSAKDNDQPAQVNPSPLGNGMRLRDVQDPSKNACNGLPCANQNVNVTSVVVTFVDTFDETQNGKSRGTVFVQDADIAGPFAGISMYSPTFVPANLRLAPGDVIDMSGQYTEQTTIGSTVVFPTGSFLPQMNKPQVTPSFETPMPAPVVVQLADLQSFAGRKWIGMLVTIQDVTVVGAPTATGSGRVAATVSNIAGGLMLNNELFDLQAWSATNPTNPSSFAAGTHFKSITGIVDFFFNLFLAPRSMADLVQ